MTPASGVAALFRLKVTRRPRVPTLVAAPKAAGVTFGTSSRPDADRARRTAAAGAPPVVQVTVYVSETSPEARPL